MYVFIKGMPPPERRAICEAFNNSLSTKYLVCTQDDSDDMSGFDVDWLHTISGVRMSGSSQTHSVYFYRRKFSRTERRNLDLVSVTPSVCADPVLAEACKLILLKPNNHMAAVEQICKKWLGDNAASRSVTLEDAEDNAVIIEACLSANEYTEKRKYLDAEGNLIFSETQASSLAYVTKREPNFAKVLGAVHDDPIGHAVKHIAAAILSIELQTSKIQIWAVEAVLHKMNTAFENEETTVAHKILKIG